MVTWPGASLYLIVPRFQQGVHEMLYNMVLNAVVVLCIGIAGNFLFCKGRYQEMLRLSSQSKWRQWMLSFSAENNLPNLIISADKHLSPFLHKFSNSVVWTLPTPYQVCLVPSPSSNLPSQFKIIFISQLNLNINVLFL